MEHPLKTAALANRSRPDGGRAKARCLAAAACAGVLLLAAAGCSAGPPTEAEESLTQAAETSDVPLSVVAGLVGTSILVQNHSAETLENITIVVNDAKTDAEFRYKVAKMNPSSTMTFLTQMFVSEDGATLDPSVHKITSFAVYADTPRGRGHWSGSY